MADLSRTSATGCLKVFVQRDYSEGTNVKFQTKRPQQLEDKVDLFIITVNIYRIRRTDFIFEDW